MEDVYKIYLDVLDKVNKEENGYLTIEYFNRVGNRMLIELQNKEIKRLQNPSGVTKIQMHEDWLSPYSETKIMSISSGRALYPDDYAYYINARVAYDGGKTADRIKQINSLLCDKDDPTVNREQLKKELSDLKKCKDFKDLQLLTHDRVSSRLNSFIPGKQPSQGKPIMEQVGSEFIVYPCDTISLCLVYYRQPKPFKLVMSENSVVCDIEYNEAESKGVEIHPNAINELVNMIANEFSSYTGNREMYQTTNIDQSKAAPTI